MKSEKFYLLLLITAIMCTQAFGQGKNYFNPDQIDIPYTKYVLDNGLTLIVHEDHKAPIVAVNIWYHVGSKNEKAGRTGFAHLFEHLMFNGSENYNKDYFQALEAIGATDLNGTTGNDRTNYFQNVPVAALDRVLFLESDRMGHLLGAIDQAKLDEQRGVVQNEKRQYDNQPYGREDEIIPRSVFPVGHPYSWSVIGSMEDLDAASLQDVKTWFSTYYGPSNAVISIAGDVNPEDILQRVKKYFGAIPPGPSLTVPGVNLAKRTEDTRTSYQDNVPEPKVSMIWNVPQWGTREAAMLDLASRILSSGKTSRLYKKLVYEDQIASRTYTYLDAMEIAGNFYMVAFAKPGKKASEIESAMNAIMAEFLEKGPMQEELDRVRATYFANLLKGIERIGGFGGKSDILASNEVYGGSPDHYKTMARYVAEAKVEDIHKVCKDWLSEGRFILVCEPFPQMKPAETTVDRSSLPALGKAVSSSFPDLQKATLKNGLQVVLAQRKGVPTIAGRLLMHAGYASDAASKSGLANLAMDMIDEGTKTRDALQISEQMQLLGASIYAGSDMDYSYLNFTTLKPTFEPTLELWADILLNPAFSPKEFERLKKQHLDDIEREKSDPFDMALRVLPQVLYGKGHPYGIPLYGSGFQQTVNSITIEDVQKFYQSWIKPNNATLVIVGDVDMAQLKTKLESLLGDWKKGDIAKVPVADVSNATSQKIYLINRPEAVQSVILASYLTVPYGKVSQPSLDAMNNLFGGDFVSRLNMNLREDKHWSYGAGSTVFNTNGQRPLVAYVQVQGDKTKESIQEIMKEFTIINKDKPISDDEFSRVQENMTMQLPGMWETNNAVGSSVVEMVKYNLSDDYYKTYDTKVRQLTKEEIQRVTKQIINSDMIRWIVVGDRNVVLPGLKELGEVIEIDADGNVI